MTRFPRKLSVLCVAAACSSLAAAQTVDLTPAQWFQQGSEAVKEARQLQGNHRRAKNVILFVGDGMGISTVTAARIFDGQAKGLKGEENQLSFEKLPYLALSKTYSVNQQTSDSAPTATAMVTGVKTNDGAISVDHGISRNEPSADVTNAHRLRTILEQAKAAGMAAGVVTTTRVTHATPAVNYAHISDRDWEHNGNLPAGATVKDIAAQLIDNFGRNTGPDVVMGGGRTQFYPNTVADPEYPSRKGGRSDGRHLVNEWLAKNDRAVFAWNKAQFDAIDSTKTDRVLALFERSHMYYDADRTTLHEDEPSLAEMTGKAIDILGKNPEGFYLMVEGGRIDHAHHAGNAYRALQDTRAFADAVQMAINKVGLEDTLIIVTADHSHTLTIAGYPGRGNPILGKAAFDGVEAKDALGLPYTTLGYANGPGWAAQGGKVFVSPTNGPSGAAGSETAVAAGYDASLGRPDLRAVDSTTPNFMQEAAVPIGSETHAGEDVAIFAGGPSAHLFHGVMEQNVIYHVMREALRLSDGEGRSE